MSIDKNITVEEIAAQYRALPKLTLAPDELEDMLFQLKQRPIPTPSSKRKLSRWLGTSVAGLVGVAVVGSLFMAVKPLGTGEGTTMYSMLQNHVPASQLDQLKNVIKHEGITNMELPTTLPFTPTAIRLPDPPIDRFKKHSVQFFIVNNEQSIEVQADMAQVVMLTFSNQKIVKLNGGISAKYGNGNELVWRKNGVNYFLTSFPSQGSTALSESQLVDIANSFK